MSTVSTTDFIKLQDFSKNPQRERIKKQNEENRMIARKIVKKEFLFCDTVLSHFCPLATRTSVTSKNPEAMCSVNLSFN